MRQLYAYVADETTLGVILSSTIYSVEKICMHWYYLGLKYYEKKRNIHILYYCETHKTVNTRSIYGMLLCCEEKTNKAWET